MRRLMLLLTVCLTALVAAGQQSFPKPTGYVDDFAHVLSPGAQAELEMQAAELHEKTRAQVFVVTIDTLNGNDIKPFTNDLFHTWKIGEKGTDRGALILFAIADHKWRIEVGSGLEGILNDAKVGDIGRSVVPELKTASYDDAAEQAFTGVAAVIAADAHVSLTPAETDSSAAQTDESMPQTDADSGNQTESASADSSHGGLGCGSVIPFAFFGFLAFVIGAVALLGKGGRSGSSGSGVGRSSGSSFSDSDSSSSSSDSSDSSSSSSDFSGGDGGDSSGGGADGSW